MGIQCVHMCTMHMCMYVCKQIKVSPFVSYASFSVFTKKLGNRAVTAVSLSLTLSLSLSLTHTHTLSFSPTSTPRRCGDCSSLLRPHVVWFGEGLEMENLKKIDTALKKCDLFLLVSVLTGEEGETERGGGGGVRERERGRESYMYNVHVHVHILVFRSRMYMQVI